MAEWIDLADCKELAMKINLILDRHINDSSEYPAELFEIKRELLASIKREQSFPVAPAVNRWIPCSERLPEPLQTVIVCTVINTVTVAWGNGDHWTFADTGNGYTEDWALNCVKFWMPLPEPPEKEC